MEEQYSRISESFEGLAREIADRSELRPVSAFPKKETTPAATARRVKRATADFWYFDKTYFVPEQYQDYAKPCAYHETILREILSPGITIHAGPRDCGKTAFAKKIHIWLLLTGRTHILGLLSYVLPNAQNLVRDTAKLITANDRINHDFRPEFIESNADQFAFRTLSKYVDSKRERYAAAFSEGRSVRGFTREFARPERLYCDDLETLTSPIGGEHTERRLRLLDESFASLGGDKKTLWSAGNNFDTRGYIAVLLKEQEQGILQEGWRITVHKAFADGKSIWPEKYPAQSEDEMRTMVKARTIADWNANYQQHPTPPEGHVFKRQHLQYWEEYPSDCKGVIYTDPNLAFKSLGDTASGVRLTYSPKTDLFYLSAFCRSFSEPGKLLEEALNLRKGRAGRIVRIGMDGNVSQESHWRSHIKAWCRINEQPYPTVKFCRYTVDDLATNFQTIYNEGRVRFDPAMSASDDGQRFFQQFFGFVSKKEKRKDDAPDAAICAYQLLVETNLNQRGGTGAYSVISFNDGEDY